MNFQPNVTRLIITACQGADRRWVTSDYCYYLMTYSLILLDYAHSLFADCYQPSVICVCVGVRARAYMYVGVQDMVGRRMGPDTGRNLPWAHAGAHPDEVHLYQSIRVRLFFSSYSLCRMKNGLLSLEMAHMTHLCSSDGLGSSVFFWQ